MTKVFAITWTNCFMEEGTTKIKAKSRALAEAQFGKDFGPDYMIIFTRA